MNTRRFAEGERVKEERRPPEPAPLPLHALLELQRTAGNQAVGRMIARQKVPDQRRSGFLKQVTTGKTGTTTAATTLLAMLNAYGLTVKPKALGPWVDPEVAITALKAAKKFDDDDEREFRKAADDKFPAPRAEGAEAGPDANTVRLETEIAEDRQAVEDQFSVHIFDGIWKTNGEPGGYHSVRGNSATHEAFGKETPIGAQGVYQQSVRQKDDHTNIKESQSTFFPKTASKDDVIKGVTTVFGARGRQRGLTTMQYPKDLKGIVLQQIDATTVFPAGGGGKRGEGWMSAEDKKKAKKNKS